MAERVEALAAALEATEELPVEREASRWLGEAAAIATDLSGSAVDEATARERVETVAELLAEIEGTGDPRADRHVAAARRLARRYLEESPHRR